MEATCSHNSWDSVPDSAPVQISRLDNNILNFRYEDSGNPAGMVVSEPLARLMKEHSVTLTAYVGAENGRRSNLLESSRFISGYVRVAPVRIIVYGFLSEKDDVADLLDEGGLFLQHPEESEYDRRVKYLNPMFLLPPGKDMPKIQSPRMAGGPRNRDDSVDQEELGEVEQSRMLKIFDEASGPTDKSMMRLKQSTRIISTLKEYVMVTALGGAAVFGRAIT
jgi:hypothetical protein